MTRKHVPDLLRRHIETANRKHRQGRLGDAEADYMKALSMAPGHPEILRLLGLLKHPTGDVPAAIELLTRSVKARPGNARALETLGCFQDALFLPMRGIGHCRSTIHTNEFVSHSTSFPKTDHGAKNPFVPIWLNKPA